MIGFVYFVQAGPDGPIKIGFTGGRASLERRLNGIQVSCPYRINLLGVMVGDQAVEEAAE